MILDQVLPKSSVKPASKSELKTRSVLKALSWRMVGTLDTVLLSWVISGKWQIAMSIGTLELVTKTILYYFHERAWNVVKWGR